MPYPRRTGPCDSTSSHQEDREACQAKGGCTRQGEMWTGRGCSGGGAEGRFRTEMNCGRRPSAHGGSDSQGAPCASCRHADDQEKSLWRVGVLKREGREVAPAADPLDVTANLHFEVTAGLSSSQHQSCQSSSSCHLF